MPCFSKVRECCEFRQYVKQLTKEAGEQRELKRLKQVSELDAIFVELKVLQDSVTKCKGEFRTKRTQKLLSSTAASKIPFLRSAVDHFYKGDPTTAAFQIGFLLRFSS